MMLCSALLRILFLRSLFHLAEDFPVFLQRLEEGEVGKDQMGKENAATILSPGRPVGGLLLMHPIYVASKLSIVLQQTREYMTDCLEWIAKHMGDWASVAFCKSELSTSTNALYSSG